MMRYLESSQVALAAAIAIVAHVAILGAALL